MDADGYGARRDQDATQRLLEDLRTFSPLGIERAATGWTAHDANRLESLHEAERTALKALEDANAAPAWEELRRTILDLTEGRSSLVAWRAEHGETGHAAEDAALAAALGLMARDKIDSAHFEVLVGALAEALPWLGEPGAG